ANLDVWEAGVAISLLANPMRVVASRSTYQHDIKLANPEVIRHQPRPLTPARLATSLGFKGRERQQPPRIHSTRLLIYRYDIQDPNAIHGQTRRGVGVVGPEARLPVPPVPQTITPGNHYV